MRALGLVVVALVSCKGKPAAVGAPCGMLGCLQFDSPALAFREATKGDARVVSIGEAHAQKGASVASSARRFTDEILPSLPGRASDLVVELMMPPAGCAPKVAAVREAQAPVTSHQAVSDQGEYVAMGEAARKLGIVPDLLRPTCADLASIEDAGDDSVDVSLRTIARLTREKVQKLVGRAAGAPADADKFVLTYGGAVHIDPAPQPDRRAWSFGPDLAQSTGGRYVAIDLYVPDFIDGSEVWRKQAWYAHYDPARLGGKTTMFKLGERSYVILFPRGGR